MPLASCLLALILTLGPSSQSRSLDVGYLGCSETWQSVEGYHAVGGQRMWPPIEAYGGATVHRLTHSPAARQWWNAFDAAQANNGPPAVVWFQICALVAEPDPYADAVAALNILRQHTTAPIQVSGLPCFESGYGGDANWQGSRAAAARIVSEGRASAGPVMPCVGAGTTAKDRKHLSPDGEALMGQTLKDWFG